MARDPDEFVFSIEISDPGFWIVAWPECRASRTIGADVRSTFRFAIIETDIVTPHRTPSAGHVELVAKGTRGVRC